MRAHRVDAAPLRVDGQRRWVEYEDLDRDEGDFEQIGAAFAATGRERTGTVGTGIGRLLRVRHVVDFAVDWMAAHRPASLRTVTG